MNLLRLANNKYNSSTIPSQATLNSLSSRVEASLLALSDPLQMVYLLAELDGSKWGSHVGSGAPAR